MFELGICNPVYFYLLNHSIKFYLDDMMVNMQ